MPLQVGDRVRIEELHDLKTPQAYVGVYGVFLGTRHFGSVYQVQLQRPYNIEVSASRVTKQE